MIALLAPWVLGAAIAGALGVVALHFLSVRRPPELFLPTTRFLPDRTVRAVSRTKRPSDVLLMLLRCAALLAVGVAAAEPQWRARSRTRVTLVVVDRDVVRDTSALRAVLAGAGGVPADAPLDFVFTDERSGASADPGADRGALMPLAWRAAARSARRDAAIDSFDLHVMLTRAPDARDEGWSAWRDAWPGRVITHAPAVVSVVRPVVLVTLDDAGTAVADDDPVRSALAWHAARSLRGDRTRIAGNADTVGVARTDGALLTARTGVAVRVVWPLNGVPSGWRPIVSADTVSALVSAGRAMMGSWAVTAVPDSSAMPMGMPKAVPIAWWSDGRVAATETRTTAGCDRQVAVAIVSAGDALLSTSANGLFDRLLSPCTSRGPLSASSLTVREVHGTGLAAADAFRVSAAPGGPNRAREVSWLTPLLWACGLLLLWVESRVRAHPPSAERPAGERA